MNNNTSEKQEQKTLKVELKHNPCSKKFFVDLSNENGYVVSILITEGVANGLSRDLNIKIMQ